MQYEWYVDTFWLTNSAIDSVAFLAAAFLLKKPVKFLRCLVGGCISASVSTGLFLLLDQFLWYQLFLLFVLQPLLICFLFRPKNLSLLLKACLVVNGVLLFAGGIQNCLWQVPICRKYPALWCLLLSSLAALGICKLSVGRQYRQSLCDVELRHREQKLMLQAFCDTGNLLKDPYTHQPVSIASAQALGNGFLQKDEYIRYIPYRTLGMEHGCMKVLTIDKMYIYLPGKKLEVDRPVIGLSQQDLLEQGKVQLILNGALLSGKQD